MSKIKKELACGRLYEAFCYTYSIMPHDPPPVRAKKQRKTSEAKREINKNKAALQMMRYICLNFTPGRDWFIGLDMHGAPPTREQLKKALSKFLRDMRREYRRLGLELKYIWVIEEHDIDGTGVRQHAHLILNTAGFDERNRPRDFGIFNRSWTAGSWTARRLDGSDDMFRDTADYMLKTYKHKPANARSWSHSKNLEKPAPPVRTMIADTERLETPPGVKLINRRGDENEYGGFEYLVGKIIDPKAYARYCDKRDRARRKRRNC